MLALFGGRKFHPRRLFISDAVKGAIYDYDDFAYLYQKADGSVPYTALEQPVGLMLDKRYGGLAGLSATELLSTGTVGLVGVATAATYNTSTGAGSVTRVDASNQSYIEFSGLATEGFYRITITLNTASGVIFRSGTYSGTSWAAPTGNTTSTVLVRATAGKITIIGNGAVTASFTISSFRELPGLHAYQSTDPARPVLSARYNLLLNTATLSTQSVTTLAASYTLTFTGTGTVTLSGTATGVKSAGANVFTATAGTLTLTVSGSVTLADLRLTADANSRLPAYQRVTTATDYDSAGFPRFLRIDATDDFMQTASVDPGTDKVFVCAGVTKVSDAAGAIVAEWSADSSANNGTFALLAPNGAAANYGFRSKGTVSNLKSTASSYAAPATAVVSGVGNIAADSLIVRVNGAEAVNDASDQGTGNFAAFAMYLGARGGTGTRLNNGRIYPMVICFKAVTAGEIAAVEAWVNSRTRAF